MNTKTTFLKGFRVLTIIGLMSLVLGPSLIPTTQANAALAAVAITVSPGAICVGQSAHLNWSSVDAMVTITPGIGLVSPYGDLYVSPTQTTTYTITGTNSTGGYATAWATVTVTACPTPTPYPGPVTPTPTPVPFPVLNCSPSPVSVSSGQNVTLYATGGNGNYSWSAFEGTPSYGYGSNFTTYFTNYSDYMRSYYVTVTSKDWYYGDQIANCEVRVAPQVKPTPYPTPYPTSYPIPDPYLQCSPTYSTANSGDLVRMSAWGGNGNYSWSAFEGTPSYGHGSSFSTRFYNYASYAQNRTVKVTSDGQSTICTVLVNGSYVTPTPTSAPYPNANIELRNLGRNVTQGQTGEHTSLRARGGDTLDLIIRVRSTNGSYVYNAWVTDLLPTGLSYISRSTTLNGYAVADGITGSGINVGTLSPYSETVIKLSVLVDGAYVPTWGSTVIYNTAQVRADGLGTKTAQLPITMGQNLNLATVSAVKTGPADALWLALLVSLLATGTYAVYTRTDLFGRRMALAEVDRLSRSSGPNFSK